MKRLPSAQKLGNHNYHVCAEAGAPTCSCPDFARHSYPCKHIIQTWLTDTEQVLHIPVTDYDPWWNIDSYVASVGNVSAGDQHHVPTPICPTQSGCISDSEEDVELKSAAAQTLKKNNEIKELLKHVTGQSHQTELNLETAEQVLQKLKELSSLYHTAAPKLSCIPLLPPKTPPNRKRKIISIQPNNCALKRRKYRPLRYRTGRVSYAKDYHVSDLESCLSTPVENHTEEPMAVIRNEESEVNRDEESRMQNAEDKEIPVDIDILLPTHHLDDNDINMALRLIHEQWPTVTTQDCLNIQRPKCFDKAIEYNFGEFGQIINMRAALHWIAVTNVSARTNEVRLFDSLDIALTTEVMKGIASKYIHITNSLV